MADMSDYPERQVTTSVGEVRVIMHSETTGVILFGDPDSEVPVNVYVNGIPHAGHIFVEAHDSHAGLWPGGFAPRNFFVKRTDRTFMEGNEPTDNARRKLYAAVKEAMAVVVENAEFLNDGKLAGLRQERQSKLANLARLRSEIETIEREVRVLDARIEGVESPRSMSPGAAFDKERGR